MSLPKKLQFFPLLKLATVALSGGENNRKMPEKCIFPSNFAATITTWYKHKKKNPFSTKDYAFAWGYCIRIGYVNQVYNNNNTPLLLAIKT